MGGAAWVADVMRWGQVNFNEGDPQTLDVEFWVDVWRRCRLQGVTLNAGGAVAYYPTDVPYHPRARFLGDRDLLGETVDAAKSIGLRVLARLDPLFGDQALFDVHPDWFLTAEDGAPFTHGDLLGRSMDRAAASALTTSSTKTYLTCWNGGYYREFLPAVMTEVRARYEVDGFFTNGWPTAGPMLPPVACHCPHCEAAWAAWRPGGGPRPSRPDPADETWRDHVAFVQASVERTQAGLRAHAESLDPDGTFVAIAFPAPASGLDWPRWIDLVDMVASDAQARWTFGFPTDRPAALWEVGLHGELLRAVAAGKPVVRFCGTYAHPPLLRQAAKPPAEMRLLMAEATAHGERPKWHTLGGRSHDRRWIEPVAAYGRWLADVEPYLRNTESMAEVAIVWSQRTMWLDSWAGAGSAGSAGPGAWDALSGWYLALLEARVPVELVHEARLDDLSRYSVVVLPSDVALGDDAVERLAAYAAQGGSLVAACGASQRDEWGARRAGLGLAAALGVRLAGPPDGPHTHSYLRVDADEHEHPLVHGLGDTDVVGGSQWLARFEPVDGTATVTTWVPDYPTNPTHAARMDPERTDVPILACAERPGGGRAVYVAMDLDAAYRRWQLPDHGLLLRNAVAWATAGRPSAVSVTGPGLVDVRPWRQDRSCTVHLVNLSTPQLYGTYVAQHLAVGPQRVQVELPSGTTASGARLLRSGEEPVWKTRDDGRVVEVDVPCVDDFEVVAVDLS